MIDPQLKAFSALIFSPLAVLFLQMTFSRLFMRKMPPQTSAAMCVILGYIAVVVFIAGSLSIFLYGTAVYMCIGYSYFHLFNMSETARRMRIMYEIYKAGCISRDKLRSEYGPLDMLKIRLDRLTDTKQIKIMNGRYFIENPVLYMAARLIELWRKVLGFK